MKENNCRLARYYKVRGFLKSVFNGNQMISIPVLLIKLAVAVHSSVALCIVFAILAALEFTVYWSIVVKLDN